MLGLNEIRALLDGQLNDATFTGTPPISWPNISFTPPAGGLWLKPTLLPASNKRATMTGNPATGQRMTGLYVVQVFAPANTGTGAVTSLSDEVASNFVETSLDTSLTTFTPEAFTVGNDGENRWYQINVNIPWEYICI